MSGGHGGGSVSGVVDGAGGGEDGGQWGCADVDFCVGTGLSVHWDRGWCFKTYIQ